MGKIFDGLQMTFNVNDATWFLNCYKKLSRRGLLTELEDGFKSLDASMVNNKIFDVSLFI